MKMLFENAYDVNFQIYIDRHPNLDNIYLITSNVIHAHQFFNSNH